MRKLLLLVLLLSSTLFAQTKNFISAAYGVNNPPSAYSFGIFNPANSGVNVVLVNTDLSVGFDAIDTTPYVIVGTSIARTQPTGGTCTPYHAINLDLTDSFQVANGFTNQAHALLLGQPCTGAIATNNFAIDSWVTNLNHFKIHYANSITITIPPGLGFVIYFFVEGSNMQGNITEGFQWKECPVGSTC